MRLSPLVVAEQAKQRLWLRCLGAVLAGAVAVAIRAFLHPMFGDNNVYTLFYPVIILVAFACEPWIAIGLAAVLGLVGYWCFTPPTFAWIWDGPAMAALALFGINCAVAILLIQMLVRTLHQMSADQVRAEAVAAGHAELFRELNERVTHHLQLVAGVLALQARDEPDRRVAHALLTASEQSGVLARIHRDFAGRGSGAVDFVSFARVLVRTALRSQGQSADLVRVDGPPMLLPAPQATSLSVALLECLRLIQARGAPGQVTIQLSCDGAEALLRIRDCANGDGRSVVSLAGGYLLSAMVEQLGGRLVVAADVTGCGLDLIFPLDQDDGSTSAALAGDTSSEIRILH